MSSLVPTSQRRAAAKCSTRRWATISTMISPALWTLGASVVTQREGERRTANVNHGKPRKLLQKDALGDKAEKAYQTLSRRRELMDAWARFQPAPRSPDVGQGYARERDPMRRRAPLKNARSSP